MNRLRSNEATPGPLRARLRSWGDAAKTKGVPIAVGAATLAAAGCGGQAADAPPPSTPEPLPPASAPPFDATSFLTPAPEGASFDPLSIRGFSAPTAAPTIQIGATTLTVTAREDALVGKASAVHGMLDRLARTKHLGVKKKTQLINRWLREANVAADAPIDADQLMALARALEARGVRPTDSGLKRFAMQRGLPLRDGVPAAETIAAALNARPNELHLRTAEAPSKRAATTIRFLRRIDAPRRFLARWDVAVKDGAISVQDAEALAVVAHRRGVNLSGNAKKAAKKMLPIGGRPGSEAARYHWYRSLVESEGHQLRTGKNEMNVIGLRGFALGDGLNRNALGGWNDTIAFVWRDASGRAQVKEMPATTDPGLAAYSDSPDVNGDGAGDVAHLRPGQYTYFTGVHRGLPGAGNPTVNVPVDRDTNHDGQISSGERSASKRRGDVGYGINIHWGPGYDNGAVGTHSLGCQVFRDADYGRFRSQITPLLQMNDRFPYTLVELDDVYAKQDLARFRNA